MWLEAALASLSISGLCGSALLANKLFPTEVKRFLRIVQAEIESRLPKKRPTIEIAMHADLEVDMTWWDEEFAKLDQPILTDSWADTRKSQQDAIYDMMVRISEHSAPTTAEFNSWIDRGIQTVTKGDVTYDVSAMSNVVAQPREPEPDAPVDCEFCEYKEVHTYTSLAVRRYKVGLCWECNAKEEAMKASVRTWNRSQFLLGSGYITLDDQKEMMQETFHMA